MRRTAKIALGSLGLLAAAQLVPVERDNPPVDRDAPAPAEVKAVLRRACYDCHSHETVWPPQAYVAPVSWLVARDVSQGRKHLNFSRWGAGQGRRPAKLAREIREALAEGEMPPWRYVFAHPRARLSDADRALVTGWASTLRPPEAAGAEEDQGDGDGEGRRRRGRDR